MSTILKGVWREASGVDDLFKHDNLRNYSRTMTIVMSSNQELSELSCERHESRSDLVDHSVKFGELLESFLSARHVGSSKFTMVVGRIIAHVLGGPVLLIVLQTFLQVLR